MIKKCVKDSKNELKQVSEEEINRMAKEMWVDEKQAEVEDKIIEEEEEDRRSNLFNELLNSRNALRIMKSMLNNNKMVEEFQGLLNKRKQWGTVKDINLVKGLIIVAGNVIERRYWKREDVEEKAG